MVEECRQPPETIDLRLYNQAETRFSSRKQNVYVTNDYKCNYKCKNVTKFQMQTIFLMM